MKPLLVVLLALPAWSQINVKPASTEVAPHVFVPVGNIAPQTFVDLEKRFDTELSGIGGVNDPLDVLGGTRGIYLEGYGAVFTAEASLIITPTISPFRKTITEDEKRAVHLRKLERVEPLKRAMADMLKTAATTLAQVPANQQIVLAVRLLYLPWEDTTGLPAQIMMKADRTSAMAGRLLTEVQ